MSQQTKCVEYWALAEKARNDKNYLEAGSFYRLAATAATSFINDCVQMLQYLHASEIQENKPNSEPGDRP